MISRHIVTFTLLLLVGGVLAYRSSFFKNRRLFHLTLLQIIYLVFLPGTLFIVINSYLGFLLTQPVSSLVLFPDAFLIDSAYLSMFFVYGGIAIHAVTKMLTESGLRHLDHSVAVINRFFHLTFSHNLIFSGTIVLAACLALLELNHLPIIDSQHYLTLLIRGLVMTGIILFALVTYTRSPDQYVGRWADLKAVFATAWAALILLFYVIFKTEVPLSQFPLTIPILITLIALVIIHLGLVIRRIHRHHLYSPHRFIAFHRQKRHPAVQKSQNQLKRRLQHKVKYKHQKV